MGGAAVVYRHAEGLAARGHEVTVAAPQSAGGVGGLLRRGAVWIRDRLHGVGHDPYHTAPGVRTLEPTSPLELGTQTFDAVIATGHQTAQWVYNLSKREGQGIYFLQHDERHLSASAERTWRLPLTRVAVAEWIAEVVASCGAPVVGVVPNAVDPEHFAVDQPIEEREMRVVALYHRLPVKGPDTLTAALESLREHLPGVSADIISARPPSHRLPSWVELHVRPSRPALREIYNRSAVCLHTSRLEGWGLVPMEAAACGCAVVATASRGVAEFLRAGHSMLEVPVGDADALARETAELLRDTNRRIELAEEGREDVSRFTWDASTARLEAILLEHVLS